MRRSMLLLKLQSCVGVEGIGSQRSEERLLQRFAGASTVMVPGLRYYEELEILAIVEKLFSLIIVRQIKA